MYVDGLLKCTKYLHSVCNTVYVDGLKKFMIIGLKIKITLRLKQNLTDDSTLGLGRRGQKFDVDFIRCVPVDRRTSERCHLEVCT